MIVRAILVSLVLLGCGGGDPPLDTPEGVAIAALRAARAGDVEAYLRIARNPNQALLEQSGARPAPGSYARVLLDEGEAALREEFAAAARGPLPSGTLTVSAAPLEGGAHEVTVAGTEGGALHVMVVATDRGPRATHLGAGAR